MSAKEARVVIGGFVNQMRLSGINYPLPTIHDCLVAPWSACKEFAFTGRFAETRVWRFIGGRKGVDRLRDFVNLVVNSEIFLSK